MQGKSSLWGGWQTKCIFLISLSGPGGPFLSHKRMTGSGHDRHKGGESCWANDQSVFVLGIRVIQLRGIGDKGASEDKNPVHCSVRQPRVLMLGCRDVTMPLNASRED